MDTAAHYIDVHTHNHAEIDGVRRVINIRLEESGVLGPNPALGSVGIHPWDAARRDTDEDARAIAAAVQQDWCVAVGEVGLDRVNGPDLDAQRDVLDRQLDLAAAADLPVIFHCVRAHADLMQLRKQRSDRNPWIIHGFSGHAELADQLLRMDFHLSFGMALLEVGGKARQALSAVPLDRLFFETDEAEIDIRRLYREAAGLLFRDESEVRDAVEENFRQCFGVVP